MYHNFHVTEINPQFEQSRILIKMSLDIDESTVNDKNVQLYFKEDRNDVNTKLSVVSDVLYIDILNEIIPNADYVLRISDLQSVLEDPLTSGLRRTFQFKTGIKQVLEIASPANYEEIEDLKIKMYEPADETALPIENKKYFIQIAKEVSFMDIAMETVTESLETNLKNLPQGQYFLRARIEGLIEEERHVGRWSEVATFISLCDIKPADDSEEGIKIIMSDEPEFIREITVISEFVNGETPSSILIELSDEIDPQFLEGIIVLRRDV